MSTPGNLPKGSTASFTATWCMRSWPHQGPAAGRGGRRSIEGSDSPSITRTATLARGTPVALPTKGTVRDARGLTSRQYTVPSLTANWALMRPRTPRASASRSIAVTMAVMVASSSEWGGSTQAESPEWTPASSMCSRIPPT